MNVTIKTLLIALGASLMLLGCHYTPQRIAFVGASTTVVSVETALIAYNEFAKAGKTTVAQNIAVKNAFEKYQLSAAVVCDAGAVYAATGGTNHVYSAALQTATLHMSETVADLLNLIRSFGIKI